MSTKWKTIQVLLFGRPERAYGRMKTDRGVKIAQKYLFRGKVYDITIERTE